MKLSTTHSKWWLPAWLVVSGLLMAVAFLGGTLVDSPLQDAVQNSEREIQATWAVELRSAAPEVEPIEGSVRSGARIEAGASIGAGEEATREVVTATSAAVGDRVSSGDAPVFVSSRPLILLALRVPLYRDLHPGDVGEDVTDLQQALRDLGLYAGTADGEYGARTAVAVKSLYERHHATPPSPAEESVEAVKQLEAELKQKREELTQIEVEIERAATPEQGVPEPMATDDPMFSEASEDEADATTTDVLVELRAAAQRAVEQLEEDLSDARTATLTWLPQSEILAIPAGTSTVASVQPLGTILDQEESPVISLAAGIPYIEARIRVDQAPDFTKGSPVSVALVGNESEPLNGTVRRVGEFTDGSEVEGDSAFPGYLLGVSVNDGEIPSEGESVLIRPKQKVAEVSGPSVPLTALRQDAEGPYVLVAPPSHPESSEGSEPRHVAVQPLLQDGGFVILEEGELTEGMNVILEGSG
ncbi:peptidoglycan-binding protein [Promicromonospora sp. Populi]|uniref:peptidoglycan-binding protein n=1 Tax=Promicromonospora sp. Populi TaxID=3239420 RepID=UPI0034E2F543